MQACQSAHKVRRVHVYTHTHINNKLEDIFLRKGMIFLEKRIFLKAKSFPQSFEMKVMRWAKTYYLDGSPQSLTKDVTSQCFCGTCSQNNKRSRQCVTHSPGDTARP